ncbi:MAG: sensor domain-containing diguanylate cyclase [Patulibacter sp.]
MKLAVSPTSIDLVPLAERLRLIAWFRGAAIVVVLISWWLLPASRGCSLATLAAVSGGYFALTLLIAYLWRRSGRRAPLLFSCVAMADALFIAWATYGQAGLDTPVRSLILLQIITIALLASFKTGIKLALFNTWLLIGSVYLQEAGVANLLGGDHVVFGSDEYRALAVDIAVYFMVALSTSTFAAVNERELRRRRYDLEALAQFALRLDHADTPTEVVTGLLDAIAESYGCEPSLVASTEPGGKLRVVAARGLQCVGAPIAPEDAPVVASAVQHLKTRLVARREERFDALLSCFGDGTNVVVLPLSGQTGATGALLVVHPARRGSRIERRVTAMLERFASHAALAFENVKLLAEVRALAVTDPLTGLPNRRQLDTVLERATAQVRRGHGTLAMMMIDIDHFKALNDTHGHQMGDEMLRRVARALDRDLAAGDLAARYGGEEFSIVMPGRSPQEVLAAANRLRRAVAQLGGPVPVTVSIGVAWAPDHGVTRDTLIEAADAALYRAKRGGRNCVVAAAARTELADAG